MNPVIEDAMEKKMLDLYKSFVERVLSLGYLPEERRKYYLDCILEDEASCKNSLNKTKKRSNPRRLAMGSFHELDTCDSSTPLNRIKKTKPKKKRHSTKKHASVFPQCSHSGTNAVEIDVARGTVTRLTPVKNECPLNILKRNTVDQALTESESELSSLMESNFQVIPPTDLGDFEGKTINLGVPIYTGRPKKKASFANCDHAKEKVVCKSCHTKWFPRNTASKKKVKSPPSYEEIWAEFDREWEDVKGKLLKRSIVKKRSKKKCRSIVKAEMNSTSSDSSPNDRKLRYGYSLGAYRHHLPTDVHTESDIESVPPSIQTSASCLETPPSFMCLNKKYMKLMQDLDSIEKKILKHYMPHQSPKYHKKRRKRVISSNSFQRFRKNGTRTKQAKLRSKKRGTRSRVNDYNDDDVESTQWACFGEDGDSTNEKVTAMTNPLCTANQNSEIKEDNPFEIPQTSEDTDEQFNVNIIYQFFSKNDPSNDSFCKSGSSDNPSIPVPAVKASNQVKGTITTSDEGYTIETTKATTVRPKRIPYLSKLFSKLKNQQKK